jgi:transcriptional regulator with XRE-family HTH domain
MCTHVKRCGNFRTGIKSWAAGLLLAVIRVSIPMPLEPEELKNRVAGARTLRGMSQAQLGALVAGDGHGKHDVGRLERGELILTRSLRRSLAEHLSVPEAWFVDETIEIPGSADDEAGQLDRIEDAVNAGREDRTVAVDAIQELLQRQSRVLANIERLLRDMQVVAAGMPTGRSVDALTRELEAQEARAQGARAARSSAAKGAGRARRTGQGG